MTTGRPTHPSPNTLLRCPSRGCSGGTTPRRSGSRRGTAAGDGGSPSRGRKARLGGAMYLETKYPRDISRGRRGRHEVPVGLQEEMTEGGAEVGAVHVGLALRARVVNVLLVEGASARE